MSCTVYSQKLVWVLTVAFIGEIAKMKIGDSEKSESMNTHTERGRGRERDIHSSILLTDFQVYLLKVNQWSQNDLQDNRWRHLSSLMVFLMPC